MRRPVSVPVLASLAALAIAVSVVVVVLLRALELDPLPRGGAPAPPAIALATPVSSSGGTALVLAAVEQDPFHPERRPPDERFRLPGEPVISAAIAESVAPSGALRLLGTVLSHDGSGFAMCRLGDGAAKAVRVGGQVGGFTLISLGQGHAVFTTPDDGRLDLRVSNADR